jgi:hypothetical protein
LSSPRLDLTAVQRSKDHTSSRACLDYVSIITAEVLKVSIDARDVGRSLTNSLGVDSFG